MKWLEEQGVSPALIKDIKAFRSKYDNLNDIDRLRIAQPVYPYFGKEVLENAISVILEGENLLLSGGKASGKNILAENLSMIFHRPMYNAAFNLNTDSHALLGSDTFTNNEVVFKDGLVFACSRIGGFCILDEVNMAKNDAVSVLHSVLDHRRLIEVSGYEPLKIHEATRFIATMNYGYAGTRELNEALASRFMVIDIPSVNEDILEKIINVEFSYLDEELKRQVIRMFLELQTKAKEAEISSRVVDIRGLLNGLRVLKRGVSPYEAFMMGLVNKTFDEYERQVALDVIRLRFNN